MFFNSDKGGQPVRLDDEEAKVRVERARAVGMFRYQLIREAADAELSRQQRGKMVRELAAQDHIGPFGKQVRIARTTLDRWIRDWRAGGFDALVPNPRQCSPRTDPEVLEMAVALRRENPQRTAAAIQRILRKQLGWSPDERTLQRNFVRLGLFIDTNAGGEVVFGRFEAAAPNDLWTGDALYGIRIQLRKTYLFAFIDDHSRLVPGYRWGYAEDTVRLAAALRPALASRGVPKTAYVDNGSAFVDNWLLRACAKLGIRLTHSAPGRPQGRGKIERFFRTVNDQFLVEITGDPNVTGRHYVADLDELNRLFTAWVETQYHRSIHSETGQTPMDRWCVASPVPLPTPETLTEAFLWEEHRRVTKTALVFLHGNSYEVDGALVGRQVELVFDPFDLTCIEVRLQGVPMGLAVPHHIGRHSHPKAKPEILTTPSKPSGIDYMQLVADTHQGELARGINYDALSKNTTESTDNCGATATSGLAQTHTASGQIPGQLDLLTGEEVNPL
jgi:putative transposase